MDKVQFKQWNDMEPVGSEISRGLFTPKFHGLIAEVEPTNQPTKQMPKHNMYFLSQKVKPAGAAAGAASASQGLISGCQALAMTNSINWRHTSNQTDN